MTKKLGVAGWHIYDLWRMARTLMAEHGVTAAMAERVLGHEVQGAEETCDSLGCVAEKKHALDVLAEKTDQILEPKPAVRLIPLRSAPSNTE